MSTTVDLSGTWRIDDGASTYPVQLTQKLAHVVGMYDMPGGHHGQIDGFVSGGFFEFRWDQPSNRRGGTGNVRVANDGMSMEGTWLYDPTAYDSGLSGSGNWNFRRDESSGALGALHDRLKQHMTPKGYLEVEGVAPLQWGFVKPAGTFREAYEIGVFDARNSRESVSQTFDRVSNWFVRASGGGRAKGLLLFVYVRPEGTITREIEQARFFADGIAVAAGAYDLVSGSYWLSSPYEWKDEVFG
jgi:hypothetical protein